MHIIENSEGYCAHQVVGKTGRGRPQLLISHDKLEYFDFTWTEIGNNYVRYLSNVSFWNTRCS